MIQLNFLGAMGEVGKSGILVDTGTERIVLDYGTKVKEVPPQFPLPVSERPDAILLSHAHFDHSGGIPIFFTKGNSCHVYAINVTKPLTEMLLLDSIKISREEGVKLPFTTENVEETIKNFVDVGYRRPFKINKTEVTAFDAGHIPGSAMFSLNFGDKTLLYTGDYNTADTCLLKGMDQNLPEVDVLITESTYSLRNHPDRNDQEKELVKIVEDTMAAGGVCLIAGFAIARLNEVLLVLDKNGINYPVYMDGMAKKATTITNQYSNLLRKPEILDKGLEKVKYVSSDRMRKKIIKHPCVILSTSGMLQGGPIVSYLKKFYEKRNCSLILSGWQIEDTPGRILLETGRYVTKELDLNVKMFVKRLDFSSHVGRKQLFRFIERINPEKIFCIHGDHTEDFANELKEKGFDAIAPLANNRVFVI